MRVSQLWQREHGSGNDMEDVRRAMREANARRDRRMWAFGRNLGELLATIAMMIVFLTALGLIGKALILAWQWILS
jgi:hypothetical protein